MKSTILILSTFFLFGCFNRDFTVINSTSQKWVGGIPGAGKGTNYEIKIITYKSSDKLQIDKIWIGSEYYDVLALKNVRNKKDLSFDKNDTLTIKIHKYIRTNMLGEELKPKIKPENKLPQKYDGDALLGFIYKGKRKYKIVEQFEKLPFVPYQ